MKIISGGQTGVDRAALDFAIARGLDWGGWCPKGGWAEDLTSPPGLLATYSKLQETPLADPLQRTEWNIRDSDAALIMTDEKGLQSSSGTQRAHQFARDQRKPTLIVDVSDDTAPALLALWLRVQQKQFGDHMILSIGGPRESEAPEIYTKTKRFLNSVAMIQT